MSPRSLLLLAVFGAPGCYSRLEGVQDKAVDDTGPAVDTADDTASDSNPAAEPVIDAVSPTDGPTSGGQQVTIDGQFTTVDVRVTFGGGPARVISHSNSRIVVETPAHAAGGVEITVTTDGVSASTSGQYTYWTGADDKTTAFLWLAQLTFAVPDWGDPMEFQGFYPVSPMDLTVSDIWGTSPDTCRIPEPLPATTPWGTSLTLTRSDGASWALPASGNAFYLESAQGDVTVWDDSATYGIEAGAGANNPSFDLDPFAELPAGLTLSAPDLSGDGWSYAGSAIPFTWSGTAGDFVIITLFGFDSNGNLSGNDLECLVKDDGSFTIGASVMDALADDAGAYVDVSRVVEGEATADWNGGSVISAGEYRISGYTWFY